MPKNGPICLNIPVFVMFILLYAGLPSLYREDGDNTKFCSNRARKRKRERRNKQHNVAIFIKTVRLENKTALVVLICLNNSLTCR